MTEKRGAERPSASKRQKVVAFASALLAIALMGAWEYLKYTHGHGFFRLFDYGGIALAAGIAAAVVLITVLVLREK